MTTENTDETKRTEMLKLSTELMGSIVGYIIIYV
jgi:hypothetical protein